MNFIQIVNRIEAYALSLPYVNEANIGDVYEYLNGKPDIKYASVDIDIISSTRNDNQITYNVQLYYIDRLKQDGTNAKEIKTTAEQVLNSIINYAADKLGDVEDGYTITYFEQQFADYVAGGQVTISLDVPNELGNCMIDEYEDEDEKLIEKLKELIRQYEEENYELSIVLKQILYKLNGEIL